MGYSIPQTAKTFITQDAFNIFNHRYIFTQNANETYIISNPNAYAIDVLCVLNAGSGDTNTAYTESAYNWSSNVTFTQYRYNSAGRVGTNINLIYDDKVLFYATGGSGTAGGKTISSRSVRRWTSKGGGLNSNKTYQHEEQGAWSATKNVDNRREGESVMGIFTLKPNTSAEIKFIYNNASNAPFKGSITLSGIY